MSERDVNVQQMWHEQPREEHAMSINEIRERAQRFERRVQRNNILTALLIVVIVAVELWQISREPELLEHAGGGRQSRTRGLRTHIESAPHR